MAEGARTIGEGFEVYVTGSSPNFEDQLTGSEVQDCNNCDPCLFDNTQTEAQGFCHECNEFLCDHCLQSHRKFRSFRDHNILTGSSMPRNKNKHTEKDKSVFKVCDDHRMNEVQFFCYDHKSVFCGLCKRGKHSSCETKTITETINDQDEASLLEAVSNIESIKIEFEKLKQKDCDKIDEVKQMHQNCKSQLKVIKKQMEEMFEELEKEADIENTEASVVELKENIEIYEDAIKHITALDDHVKHVTTSKDAVAIFAAQAKLRKLHAEYMIVKETFHFKAEKKVSQKLFQKITEIHKLFEDIQKKVVPEKAKDLGSKANMAELANDDERKYKLPYMDNSDKSKDLRNLNSATPHVMDSIKFSIQTSHGKPVEVDKGHVCEIAELESQSTLKQVKVNIQEKGHTKKHKFEKLRILSKFLISANQDETVPCNITGLTFLPNNFLVLCNNANSELILLDKSFEVCHKLKLSSAPWDIALVKENKMAVTFPAVKQYMNVTVESKILKLGSSNRTKRKCWGIAAHKDIIVLSCHDNPGNATIEVRTSGQKLLEISMNQFGEDALLSPFYIDINKSNGNIFVTDSAQERLYSFSMEGQLLWKYEIKGIEHPYGVIVDDLGNCIVCVDNIMKLMMVKEKTKALEELWLESDIFTIWQSQKRIPQSIAINWENETIAVGHKSKNQIQVIRWFTKKSRGQSTAGKK